MSYDIDFSFLDADPYERSDQKDERSDQQNERSDQHSAGEHGGAAGGSGSAGDAVNVPARDMMRDQADAVRSADEAVVGQASGTSEPPEASDPADQPAQTDDQSVQSEDAELSAETSAIPGDSVVTDESSIQTQSATDAFEALLAGSATGQAGNAARTLSDTPFNWLSPNEKVKVQLPAMLVQALRDHLTSTLVAVWKVPADQARAFADRRSQAGLVLAFIAAQLDLRLPVDEATAQCSAVYACSNPLLGQVVSQLHTISAAQQSTAAAIGQVRNVAASTQENTDVLQLMTAWLLAERIGTGISRGKSLVTDVDLIDERVRDMRQRARGQAAEQRERDRRREGRPRR